jgi:hypothetical protein
MNGATMADGAPANCFGPITLFARWLHLQKVAQSTSLLLKVAMSRFVP